MEAVKITGNDGKDGELSIEPNTLLLAVSWLAFKHFLADFVFQTTSQFRNKHIYGHRGGLLHVGIHAVLTLPLFLIIATPTLLTGIGVIGAEVAVHYHLDWLKKNYILKRRLSTRDQMYWIAFGLDQFFHMMTYVLMLYALTLQK